MKYSEQWDRSIRLALDEDIGNGDVTTQAAVPPETFCEATLVSKEDGILCGLSIFTRTFQLIDERIRVVLRVNEGEKVEKGTILADVSGPAQGILTGERVALNFLQHLSGIATRTRQAVEAAASASVRVTDTRKTTPGLRSMEKYAVRVGGGVNHRFNLADGILIKDNHIRAAGSIEEAIRRARAAAPHTLKIEIEVESEDQIDEAVRCGADIIMLDNMSISDMKKAVQRINGHALVEASGNMGEKDLSEIAKTGVDLISIGALTHSVQAMDISLRFKPIRTAESAT